MTDLKDFSIAFSGLKTGFHNFDLSIGEAFFKKFEALAIEKGEIIIQLKMEKKERMLIFDFSIEGTVHLVCDRCLELYQQPLEIEKTIYVKLQNGLHEMVEESDDVILISDQESEFDVSQLIYEFIALSLPMKRTHGVDADGKSLCNVDMVNLIESDSQTNTNEEETDPRWDALKKLKNNN